MTSMIISYCCQQKYNRVQQNGSILTYLKTIIQKPSNSFYYIINLNFDMRNQNQHHRGRRGNRHNRNSNDQRPPRHFNSNTHQGDADQQIRRPFKKRLIKRDQQGGPRNDRRHDGKDARRGPRHDKPNEKRDLDRELRDYWVSKNVSKEVDGDIKEIAREKLNDEMDKYWKQRKEEAEANKPAS